MSKLFKVLSIIFTTGLATDGKQIGNVEEPQFSYLERNLVQVKYKIANSIAGENSSLYVCCTCNLTLPEILYDGMCGDVKQKCPNFKELNECELSGNFKHCHVSRHILPNVIFKGFVVQKDSNNRTLTSKVATYITSDTRKAPRPVTNLRITPKENNLYLSWSPSPVYTRTTKYSQLVFCQPSENKHAKAFRKMLEFRQSSLVVDSFNLTGGTEYRCCIQVENVVTSILSEHTCKNITSPEQVPISAPMILCGNGTECPFEVKGIQRNVTILFKLPDVNERNGKIIRHVIKYRDENISNQTTLELNNGSARNVTLTGLSTETSYLVFMKSCTKVGCSPSSNLARIPVLGTLITGKSPITKLIWLAVSGAVALLLIIMLLCWWRRSKRLEKIGKLPTLELPTTLGYDYPMVDVPDDTYNSLNIILNPETSVPFEENPETSVPSEENPESAADEAVVGLGNPRMGLHATYGQAV